MNISRFLPQTLEGLFKRQKIATMPELQKTLGTAVDMTVFRKLRELSYRTSYSHGNRYYTLDRLARFNEQGLWFHLNVRFSRDGTLLDTLERFVREAQAGYFAGELEDRLKVGVHESLLKLVKQGRAAREEVSGLYWYCSPEPAVGSRQLISRRASEMEEKPEEAAERVSDEIKATIVLFAGLLNEKQRRLYAGLESLRIGRGGERWIAQMLGLNPRTVARGRRELATRGFETDRIRKSGAGRPPLEKKRRK